MKVNAAQNDLSARTEEVAASLRIPWRVVKDDDCDVWYALDSDGEAQSSSLEPERLEALCRAVNAHAEWQPIETAPRDVRILVAFPSGRIQLEQINDAPSVWHEQAPMHWMPLPAPPLVKRCGVFSTVDGKLAQCTFPDEHSCFHSWRANRDTARDVEIKGLTKQEAHEDTYWDDPLRGTNKC